jgi:predicted permease
MNPGKTLNESLDLSNFGFLYGTIPTAPSVFVYAVNYGVIPDMIAATITASTFIAAPIMFVSGRFRSMHLM